MKKVIIMAIAASVAIGTICSCNSPAQKVENAKEKVESAEYELDQARLDSVADEQFKRESAQMIDDYDRQLKELKAEAEHNKRKLQAKDKERVSDLEQRNINMKKKLAEYKKSGKNEWTQFKAEFNHDMHELGVAIKDIGKDNIHTK